MAQIPFDVSTVNTQSTNSNLPKYLSLKNDGDFAVVRFMYNDQTDFELFETHRVVTKTAVFGRTVSCLRDSHDAISKCPFCEAGYEVKQKFFVRLVEYVKNADGTITAEPKIWERPRGFAYELYNKAQMYSTPLYQHIFIITKRVPNPLDKKSTIYSVDYAPSVAYPEEKYPINLELFNGYSVLGSALFVPKDDEIANYFANGEFRIKNNEQQLAQAPQIQTESLPFTFSNNPVVGNAAVNEPQIQSDGIPFVTPNNTVTTPPTNVSTIEPQITKPTRYY